MLDILEKNSMKQVAISSSVFSANSCINCVYCLLQTNFSGKQLQATQQRNTRKGSKAPSSTSVFPAYSRPVRKNERPTKQAGGVYSFGLAAASCKGEKRVPRLFSLNFDSLPLDSPASCSFFVAPLSLPLSGDFNEISRLPGLGYI